MTPPTRRRALRPFYKRAAGIVCEKIVFIASGRCPYVSHLTEARSAFELRPCAAKCAANSRNGKGSCDGREEPGPRVEVTISQSGRLNVTTALSEQEESL